MADTTIPMKFTGNSSDLERALASLEKKYADIQTQIANTKSAAKTAAQQAKEDLKKQEKAETDAARKQRDLDRQVKAEAREERRRKERDEAQSRRKTERDEAESKRDLARKEREAEREKRSAAKETQRQIAQSQRDAEREANARSREEVRRAREVATEKKRIALDEAREKKRIKREEARERQRIEREELRASEQNRNWANNIASVALGYVGVTSILSDIINLQSQIIQQTDEWGDKQDKRTRNFAVNAGLDMLKGREADASIKRVAMATGIDPNELEPAASQLVSSDMQWKEASGEGLKNLVEARSVTGDKGDLADLADNFSLFAKAQGLENTAANTKTIGRIVYAMRKAGRMESEHLEFLARQVSLAKDRPLEENLALMTNFLDVANPETAGTAFGSLHKKLRAPDTEALKEMARVGLDPKSVDFVGEDTGTVLRNIKIARDKLPEEEQTAFLSHLVDNMFLGPMKHVLDNPARFEELLGKAKDSEGYEAAIKQKQSGEEFAARQVKVKEQVQVEPKRDNTTLILDHMKQIARESGQSETQVGWSRFNAERMRNVTSNPRIAALSTMGQWSDSWEKSSTEVSNEMFGEAIRRTKQQLGHEPANLDEFSRKLLERAERNPQPKWKQPSSLEPGGSVVPLMPKGGLDKFRDMSSEKLQNLRDAMGKTVVPPERGEPGGKDPNKKAFWAEPREAPKPAIPAEGKQTPQQEYDAWLARKFAENAQQQPGGLSPANADPVSQLVTETKTTNELLRENNELIRKSQPAAPATPPRRPKPVSNASE